MEKKTKKKPSAPGTKSARTQSDYKTRESENKVSQADSKFQKELGKAKNTLRKG